jgi:DNA-binding GntR family transcriptional regulator
VLEGLAMRLACEHFTQEDYAALEEIIAQMDAAHARGDDDRLIALDIDFHNHLWGKANHNLLQQALEEMKAQILYFMYTTRPGDEKDYPSSHRELVNIMKAGEVEQASKTIQAHIHATAVRAVERWRKVKSQSIGH